MRKSGTLEIFKLSLAILDITLMLILIAFECHRVFGEISRHSPPATKNETIRTLPDRKVRHRVRRSKKRQRRVSRCKLTSASGSILKSLFSLLILPRVRTA